MYQIKLKAILTYHRMIGFIPFRQYSKKIQRMFTMFSETPTKFYANIMSAWISSSLTIIFTISMGNYEMITASSFMFVFIILFGIYNTSYNIILRLNAGIDSQQLKYFKYIPIFMFILYHSIVLRDLYNVLKNKDAIIEVLHIYNINNYKIHYQVLDADYAYSMIKKIGIISYITSACFTGLLVHKLWNEERRILNVIDWNQSVLEYSKQGSRSEVSNFDSQFNKNIYRDCLWISFSKFSYIVVAPLTLFSVLNLNVLPNILYTLFIDRAKEIYVISCIDLGLLIGSIFIYKIRGRRLGNVFMKIMIINTLLMLSYIYICSSKQYGVYEFIKVQDYALIYTGIYSIIANVYIYQVCNINYIVNSDYTYKSIPTAEVSTVASECENETDSFLEVSDEQLKQQLEIV
jgi:hypothetical protein